MGVMKTKNRRLRMDDDGPASEEKPMDTGPSGGRENDPGAMVKAGPVRIGECGMRNIEENRLKTIFPSGVNGE